MTSMRLPPLPTVRDLVKLYRISARKQLSQNFLMDQNLTDKIIKQAGPLKGNQVIEVGPGPGGLTRSIIRRLPKRLILVEKDRRFGPTLDMLGEAFASVNGRMDIIYDDILRANVTTLIDEHERRDWNDYCPNISIIGNLPFSVSTHLIIKWLQAISEHSGLWSFGRVRMLLTFQKEVAERLVAPISHPQRCRLSVMAQAWSNPRLRLLIPGSAFVPRPDVDVGVVSFHPLREPRTNHEFKFFEKVTRHAFCMRQKHCLRTIGTLFPPENRDEQAVMMFKLSDIDPLTKPVELTVEDIHRLCSAYKYLLQKHPDIRDYDYRASRKVIGNKFLRNVKVEEIDDEDFDDDDPDNPPDFQLQENVPATEKPIPDRENTEKSVLGNR